VSLNALLCGQDGGSSFHVVIRDRLRLMNPWALLRGRRFNPNDICLRSDDLVEYGVSVNTME